MSVYDFTVTDNKGNNVSLKEFEGKVLLIVNTATICATLRRTFLNKKIGFI